MKTQEKIKVKAPKLSPKNRTVTVTVMSKDLFKADYPPSKKIVDDYTALTDDTGFENRFGDPNKNFETIVFMNFEMIWKIKVSNKEIDKDYKVALISVTHNPVKGNPNFFKEKPVLKGNKVKGIINNDPKLRNKDDSYTIHFSIKHGKETRPYNLDPKLRISPGS